MNFYVQKKKSYLILFLLNKFKLSQRRGSYLYNVLNITMENKIKFRTVYMN
jgi:hypothetical protein